MEVPTPHGKAVVDGSSPHAAGFPSGGPCRCDAVRRLVVEDIVCRGGAGAIQAADLLKELAYKMGRAPKYGA